MQYVVMRGKAFVNVPGSKYSYTDNVLEARKFNSKTEALKNCAGDERVVKLKSILADYGIKI